MYLIADGGSTKVDWLILDEEKKPYQKVKTGGLNPQIISSEEIIAEIDANPVLKELREKITHVYFYGAGCSTSKYTNILNKNFQSYFFNSKICIVKEDLVGAAYSAYSGEEQYTAIIGTGSNCCYFDGNIAESIVPSLGHICGDEGSGCFLGKKVLRDYTYGRIPKEIVPVFEELYGNDAKKIIDEMYADSRPNKFLAKFAMFLGKTIDNKYSYDLVKSGIEEFLDAMVYTKPLFSKNISFIGSIAFYFDKIVREVCESRGLKIGTIIEKPIDALLDYHMKYIFKVN